MARNGIPCRVTTSRSETAGIRTTVAACDAGVLGVIIAMVGGWDEERALDQLSYNLGQLQAAVVSAREASKVS
jgi:hypothetical protein